MPRETHRRSSFIVHIALVATIALFTLDGLSGCIERDERSHDRDWHDRDHDRDFHDRDSNDRGRDHDIGLLDTLQPRTTVAVNDSANDPQIAKT